MSLGVGARLGHYSVTAKLGEGGMGEVWRSTDTQLNRDVALKILPEAFATDPDRLARFQREAQVLASLNHPNIAQIHGIEEDKGTRALVLELVEGPTLADRISKGPIPLDEALPIAKQIAEALEAAHEAGVIHRDLKPANIKVREDGTVKVLDFGLAKALDPSATADPAESPTLTAAATQMGMIMGTAAYMSPEQARGKSTDRRADIWSFGVVVFEMLSGRRAFQGRDVSETLAAVIQSVPEWHVLPAETPPRLSNLLHRCLEKEPTQRVQAIGDIRLAMEGAFEPPVGPAASDAVIPVNDTTARWRSLLVAATAFIVGAFVVGLAVHEMARPAPPLVTRLTQPLNVANHRLPPGHTLTLSPDGRTLVFIDLHDGVLLLHRLALDQFEAVPIPGTENAVAPSSLLMATGSVS